MRHHRESLNQNKNMNQRYNENPEIIASLGKASGDGEDYNTSDRVCGISVTQSSGVNVVQIDIRDFSKKTNLIVEIELLELVQAIALAAANSKPE